jgi:hypothetical protein
MSWDNFDIGPIMFYTIDNSENIIIIKPIRRKNNFRGVSDADNFRQIAN